MYVCRQVSLVSPLLPLLLFPLILVVGFLVLHLLGTPAHPRTTPAQLFAAPAAKCAAAAFVSCPWSLVAPPSPDFLRELRHWGSCVAVALITPGGSRSFVHSARGHPVP